MIGIDSSQGRYTARVLSFPMADMSLLCTFLSAHMLVVVGLSTGTDSIFQVKKKKENKYIIIEKNT